MCQLLQMFCKIPVYIYSTACKNQEKQDAWFSSEIQNRTGRNVNFWPENAKANMVL